MKRDIVNYSNIGIYISITILFVQCEFLSKPDQMINSIGVELVKIQSGNFIMGSESGDFDEKPLHEVYISKPFYISKTPITNLQYEQFDPDHKKMRGQNGFSQSDNDAVVYVSWEEANAFTEWLSKMEGKTYRLPTEAEWEYVCRAGTQTEYHTGESLPESFYLNQKKEWFPKEISLKVGETEPNEWNIYNMHGLVEEYCLDWYGAYKPDTQNDPVGYVNGDYKVTRGGSHNADTYYLRSGNRSGMLKEDKNCLVGFRIVQGNFPKTVPHKNIELSNWNTDVSQTKDKWINDIEMEVPYFGDIIYFQNVPDYQNGPLYSKHNHCPDIMSLPNGDLFATWYTTNDEDGRELTVAASRFKKGENKWSDPDVFFKVPDRNMHATSIFWDRSNDILYHFQGIGVSAGWGDLALFMRTSTDNGVTWSEPHWVNKRHGLRNMPIAGVKKTSNGYLVVPCDAATGAEGGSAIHISNDDGKTWRDPGVNTEKPIFQERKQGGTIAGIHAGVVELNNGDLMALGRGNNINGCMPKSISSDLGKTWIYESTNLPPIAGGQRLVLMRLQEGPIMLISFTGAPQNDQGLLFKRKNGELFKGHGLFAALSYDEGKTWPVTKLLTPGNREFDGGAWTSKFKTDKTHAEPRGYMAATQSPDGIIHLISSKLHYRFNLKWILDANE